MFCSNCGSRAGGNFCAKCGYRLVESAPETGVATATATLAVRPAVAPPPLPARGAAPANSMEVYVPSELRIEEDWEWECDAQRLLQKPDVKEMMRRHASQATKTMTGEDYLKAWDKIASAAHLMPIPTAALAPLAQTFWANMGMKTGKTRVEVLPTPTGRVLISLMCSLVRRGRNLRGVQQVQNGTAITAELPSDFFALAGEVVVVVQKMQNATRVEAGTNIKGQMFDWGKSTRCLNEIFEDLKLTPVF